MSEPIDFKKLCEKMAPSYEKHASKAEEDHILRKFGKGSNAKPAKTDINRHMSVKISGDRTVSKYCNCKQCKVLPCASVEREEFCCRDELMAKKTKWNENLNMVFAGNPNLSCITDWPQFKKICLDRDIYPTQKLEEHVGVVVGISTTTPTCSSNFWARVKIRDTGGRCSSSACSSGPRLPPAIWAQFKKNAWKRPRHFGQQILMAGGYCSKCKCQAGQVHRFPADKERACQWAANMLWLEEFLKLADARNSTRGITVCSRHFAITSYNNNNRTEGLRYGAIPEILVPIVTQDHEYMDVGHPQLENQMPEDRAEESQENVPIISTQSSFATNEINYSQESMVDMFCDKESTFQMQQRMKREEKNMQDLKHRNSLIAHSSFLELMNFAPGCLKCRNIDAQRTFKTIGCVLVMEVSCPNCSKWKWTSTKLVHDDRVGSYLEGNMNLSVATFTSGIPYERATDMCNILQMGITRKASHYQIVRDHARPIIQQMYEEDLTDVKIRLHTRYQATNTCSTICHRGCQFDSRGFCAGICRYALLDDGTRYIIEHQIEARKENNGNSPAMEAKALALIMSRLTQDASLNIVQLTTDKNTSVVSHMRKAHPTIRHRLDKWHVLKNFKKNNKHAIELKRNANLRAHWEHLLVHIWFSIEAADGNSELAVELIRSAEYHLQNVHILPKDEFDLIQQCTHGQLSTTNDRAYLDPMRHKEQIKVLHDMINSATFLDNVRVCAARETTSPCEQFNSLVALIYIKKNHFYDKATTSTLMQLAIMHHNSHRKEVLDREANGIVPPTRRKYSKSQGRYVEVANQPKPTLAWKVELLSRVKEHYRAMKTEQVHNRVTGRPKLSLTDISIEDEQAADVTLEDDDVLLDELDASDLEPEEEMVLDDDEIISQDNNINFNAHVISSSNSIPLLPPVIVKPIIRCSPRQFAIVYKAKGTNADLFSYINNRTGAEMLNITI